MRTILAILILLTASARAQVATFKHAETFTLSSPWSLIYNPNDFPYGAWFVNLGTTNLAEATIPIGQTLPPGTNAFFVKVLDYDSPNILHVSAGGGSGTNSATYRDFDGRWTSGTIVRSTNSFSSFNLAFSNSVSAPGYRFAIEGVLITDSTNDVMLDSNHYLPFSLPDPGLVDSGSDGLNLFPNGSFEAGFRHGFGLYANDRVYGLNEAWDNTVGFDGTASMRLVNTNGQILQAIHQPITCVPQRFYTFSLRARSTRTNTTYGIQIKNSIDAPTGFAATDNTNVNFTVGTNWTRIAVGLKVRGYPLSDVTCIVNVTGTGDSTNWIDCVMFSDSTNSTYVPSAPVELAIHHGKVGGIHYQGLDTAVPVRLHNTTTGAISGVVSVRGIDWRNKEVIRSSHAYSLAAGATNAVQVSLPSGLLGRIRLLAWDERNGSAADEASISILKEPRSVPVASQKFGTHAVNAPFVMQTMNGLGIKKLRSMSPGSYFRFNEFALGPTNVGANMRWFDQSVAVPAAAGIETMGTFVQYQSPWMNRTSFRLSGVSGAFLTNEPVGSATATGYVARAFVATNFTSHMLLLSNSVGAFSASQTVTGKTSGAVGTITGAIGVKTIAMDLVRGMVSNVVDHYKATVKKWEIANEPNQDTDYLMQDSGLYSEFLRDSILAIRSVQGTNAHIVALGGVLATNWAGNVLSNMQAVGLLPEINSLSFHIYPGNDSLAQSITTFANGFGKPWINSESGATDNGGYTSFASNARRQGKPVELFSDSERYYLGVGFRAAMIGRNHLETLGEGATEVFTYDLRGYGQNEWETRFGGLEPDDSLRPWPAAIAWMAWAIDGATSLGRSTTNTASRGYTFSGGGSNTVVALYSLSPTNILTVTMPGGFPGYVRTDLFGNPIGTNDATFTLTGYPQYLLLTNAAAGVHSAIATASFSAATDTIPPVPMISIWPAVPARTNAVSTPLQWFAIDERDKPESGARAEMLTYSRKLSPRDSVFSAWSAATAEDIAGLPAGRYTLTVIAKDSSGNTNGVTESFSIGPLPGRSRITANRITAGTVRVIQ